MSQEVLSIMFCFMQGTFAPPSTNTDCMRLWQCDYSQYAANAGYAVGSTLVCWMHRNRVEYR